MKIICIFMSYGNDELRYKYVRNINVILNNILCATNLSIYFKHLEFLCFLRTYHNCAHIAI